MFLFKPTNMKIVHLGNRFVLYLICVTLKSENYIERVSRAQKFFAHIFETIVVQMELLPCNYESWDDNWTPKFYFGVNGNSHFSIFRDTALSCNFWTPQFGSRVKRKTSNISKPETHEQTTFS